MVFLENMYRTDCICLAVEKDEISFYLDSLLPDCLCCASRSGLMLFNNKTIFFLFYFCGGFFWVGFHLFVLLVCFKIIFPKKCQNGAC